MGVQLMNHVVLRGVAVTVDNCLAHFSVHVGENQTVEIHTTSKIMRQMKGRTIKVVERTMT